MQYTVIGHDEDENTPPWCIMVDAKGPSHAGMVALNKVDAQGPGEYVVDFVFEGVVKNLKDW